MSATLDDAVSANPMIVAQRLDKGAVLMNTTNGDCFELNAVGAAVWNYIGRGISLVTVVDEIARDYGVDRGTVSTDVLRLIEELARQGIILLASR
jgi:hypothetical protein